MIETCKKCGCFVFDKDCEKCVNCGETRIALIDAEPEKLTSNNTEIRDQAHLMDAEGAEDFKPTEEQIKSYLFEKGYTASNIQISYDNLQQFWRWNCEINKLNTSVKEGETAVTAYSDPIKNVFSMPIEKCGHQLASINSLGESTCMDCGKKLSAPVNQEEEELFCEFLDLVGNWLNLEAKGYRAMFREFKQQGFTIKKA